MNFIAAEYADMHLIYSECLCNALEASRMYPERFPNRVHPHRQTFTRLDLRMRRENRLTPGAHGGSPADVALPDVEEDILERVDGDPGTSCRILEQETGISKSTVNRILRSNLLHAYHYTPVQDLHPGDTELRMQFCQELLALTYRHENFLINILWTDECMFTRDGIFNQHNYHYYADENPFVTRRTNFQHRWKVNVWGGIVGNQVLIYQFPDILRVSIITSEIQLRVPPTQTHTHTTFKNYAFCLFLVSG